MMKYITKVASTHIVECNGVNHQITEVITREGKPEVEVVRYQYGNTKINSDLSINNIHYSGKVHLAEIVLAVELVRFVLQEKK